MPTIATTIISSTSVKPACRSRPGAGVQLGPVRDLAPADPAGGERTSLRPGRGWIAVAMSMVMRVTIVVVIAVPVFVAVFVAIPVAPAVAGARSGRAR
jgi:hypothetical protein